MVSITAFSGVGAAFSAGGVAVWPTAPELNATTPTSAAIAISDLIVPPIAVLPVLNG
jgi:hypothetical protein